MNTPTIGSRLQRPVQPVLVEDDVAPPGGGDVLAELFEHLLGAGRMFAGCRAHLDADRIARRSLAKGLVGLGGKKGELLGDFTGFGGHDSIAEAATPRLPRRGIGDAERTVSGKRALSQKAAAVQSRLKECRKDEG